MCCTRSFINKTNPLAKRFVRIVYSNKKSNFENKFSKDIVLYLFTI